MSKFITRFAKDASSATAVEYTLIASLIVVAVLVGMHTIGTQASATYNTVGDAQLNLNTTRTN